VAEPVRPRLLRKKKEEKGGRHHLLCLSFLPGELEREEREEKKAHVRVADGRYMVQKGRGPRARPLLLSHPSAEGYRERKNLSRAMNAGGEKKEKKEG